MANARGEHEILASRIFRAFDVYVPCYEGLGEVMEEARTELFRNPRLTLTYLRPVVDEVLEDPGEYGGSMLPAGYEYAEGYVDLCRDIAQVEEDGYARHILEELAKSNNPRVSHDVERLLPYLDEFNVFSVGDRYKKTLSQNDLSWLEVFYLRPGLPRANVEDHLGPGKVNDSTTVLYEARGPGVAQGTLKVEYWDGLLNRWEWQ